MDTEDEGGFHDLTELAKLCGCTAKQRKLAEGLLGGLSQTEAAHRAGYAGARDSSQLRSAASAAANAKPVLALLALAESRGLGVPNAPGSRDELLRILWSHARSKDKQSSIRASVELDRIARDEMEAKNAPGDPRSTLEELAAEAPMLAVALAAEHGIEFELSPELRSRADRETAAIARTWIRLHPDEARRILDEPEPVNGNAVAGLLTRG